jgi:hypothetical protein
MRVVVCKGTSALVAPNEAGRTVTVKLDETSALVKAHLLDAKRLSKLQCADRGSTRSRSQNWKFCPKCWEAVEENAKFCPNRGKKIK